MPLEPWRKKGRLSTVLDGQTCFQCTAQVFWILPKPRSPGAKAVANAMQQSFHSESALAKTRPEEVRVTGKYKMPEHFAA